MIKTNKKGQMSLEMVIGLVILLVLAGVVISLLLHYLSPKVLPNKEEEIHIKDFKSRCESYCKDTNSLEYCTYYFDGKDWNGNGVDNELIKVGEKIKWDACEDRIYCFLVVPCPRFGENPIKGCAEQLCNAYKIKYDGNLTRASDAILKMIQATKDITCNNSMNNLKWYNNWKKSYFNETYRNENLCEHWIG